MILVGFKALGKELRFFAAIAIRNRNDSGWRMHETGLLICPTEKTLKRPLAWRGALSPVRFEGKTMRNYGHFARFPVKGRRISLQLRLFGRESSPVLTLLHLLAGNFGKFPVFFPKSASNFGSKHHNLLEKTLLARRNGTGS
jgi:hypothetical protein